MAHKYQGACTPFIVAAKHTRRVFSAPGSDIEEHAAVCQAVGQAAAFGVDLKCGGKTDIACAPKDMITPGTRYLMRLALRRDRTARLRPGRRLDGLAALPPEVKAASKACRPFILAARQVRRGAPFGPPEAWEPICGGLAAAAHRVTGLGRCGVAVTVNCGPQAIARRSGPMIKTLRRMLAER